MIDLQPKKCNLCDGRVIYTSNSKIYGREYGSGKMYYCTKCGAYVGTHRPKPKEALGILANKEMRNMKMKCHELFDARWKNEQTGKVRHKKRREAYKWLARELNISIEECHFGYFDLDMLEKAYQLMKNVT